MMNETLKVLETRRSCRAFKNEMPKDEEINAILKAGTYAASGMGKQSAIILAVKDKELRDKFMVENKKVLGLDRDFDPFYGAPVLLVVLARRDVLTHVYDGSLVMGNMMNAAHSLGLGSIWIHRAKEEFDSEFGKELLKSLNIDGDYEGIGHLAIGYKASEDKEPAPRKENYIYYL